MTNNNFHELLKNDRYQVFLFMCPSTLPFSFAAHPWFVCNSKGKISRWEVLFRTFKHLVQHGHLTINFITPIGSIEGGEGSVAHKMVEFIERSWDNYPHCQTYSLMGPNCNTYAQWVLNHFPEFRASLPWNAFGKRYRFSGQKQPSPQ